MSTASIARKQQEVNTLAESLKKAKSFITFEYKGLSAAQMTNLRSKMLKDNAEVIVIKNNIIGRALTSMDLSFEPSYTTGPNAIAISYNDELAAIKLVADVKKEADFVTFKGGFLDGKFLNESDLANLATIPSREGLYTMLLSCFTSPIRSVLYALKAVSETK